METAAVIASAPGSPPPAASAGGDRGTDAGPLGELLAAFAAGRPDALAALYDRTAPELYALALWSTGSAADAADAVQEVFVRLAARPLPSRRLRDPRAYLLAMVRRAAIDLHRRRKGGRTGPLSTAALDELVVADPAADAAAAVDAGRVTRLLARLSPPQREAVYLRHFAGLGFAAIGRVTGAPTFTAASRYRLGMARLRRLLGVTP
jgi:RNA polymerase sigma-70 factor (ECF subfamily)